MNPKDKKQFRHDKQVFNQENAKFVVLLEKTMRKEMGVKAAMAELEIDRFKWAELKKQYAYFKGF